MIRRTACTLGALALLTPAVLAVGMGTASAAGISSPADGTSYSSETNVSVSASFAGCAALATSCPSGTLTVTDPTGAKAGSVSKTASRNTGSTSLSLSVPTGSPTSRPNGTWTVTLTSGSSTTTTHYYTNLPTAAPSGFSATTSDGDPHDVFLSWTKGAEPDLQGYTLYDGSGTVVQSGITPASACSGSSCHFALYYDNKTPGTYRYTYALSASRSGGCSAGSCPAVESGKTSSNEVALTTPNTAPSPTPAPGGTTGGGSTGGTTGGSGGTTGGGTTGGSTGGTSSGGTTGTAVHGSTGASPIPLPSLDPGIQKRAFALGFSSFSASLGIPKLPPLPSTTVTLPGEGAIPQGTYSPQLPYSPKSETTKSTSLLANPITSVRDVDLKKLATPLAMALILVMCAAHLRRWIGAHSEV